MLTEGNSNENEDQDIDLEVQEKESINRITQAKAAADEFKKAENEALEKKKKRAEEKKKKRALFLNDMDNFSTDFDSKIATQEQERVALIKREEELATSMQDTSSNYVAPQSKAIIPIKILPPTPPTVEEVKTNEDSIIMDKFETISSSSNNVNQEPELKSILNANSNNNNNYKTPVVEEVLKMASRIGSGTGKSKQYASKTTNNTTTTATTTQQSTPSPSTIIQNKSNPIDDEDDEEEGTDRGLEHISNILTREERRKLSPQERAGWKAKQGDLNSKRKDFHGAVTYAFDGIFSWQMYGSAEVIFNIIIDIIINLI
jgi:hypothetical protein